MAMLSSPQVRTSKQKAAKTWSPFAEQYEGCGPHLANISAVGGHLAVALAPSCRTFLFPLEDGHQNLPKAPIAL